MSSIYLIRHCETSAQNPEAVLTPVGLEQAISLSRSLSFLCFKRIVSSPYRRAVQSAEPLAEACGIEIEIDLRLRERSLGTIDGGNWLESLALTFNDVDLSFPDGESTRVATNRAMEALNDILRTKSRPVAMFTHGNLLSLIARSFDPSLGFDFWRGLKNPDVYELTNDKVGKKLQRIAL